MFGFVEPKVKVFLSSQSDERYKAVRKAIKCILEETNLCKVYAYETAGGSSHSVINDYTMHIDDSDVIIVLIKNTDNVSDHVQNEINRAREMNKKCFFFFCDQDGGAPTQLQIDLENKGEKYCPVIHEFSDFPEKVYQSVIQEIIDIYRFYCRNGTPKVDVVTKTELLTAQTTQQVNDRKESDNTDKILYMSKKTFDNYPMTYNALLSEYGLPNITVESSQKDDEILSGLLRVVLLEENATDDCLQAYKEWAMSKHAGKVKETIERRIDAFVVYLHGDLDSYLMKMKEVHEYVQKFKSVPDWMKGDIAIDYRNAQWIHDEQKGIRTMHLDGQDYLEKTEKMLIYPNIDRFSSEIYKSVVKHTAENLLKSPYTIHMRSPKEVIKKIANIFIIAAQNVSITYMLLIQDFLLDVCIQGTYNDTKHKQLLFSVKRLLEIGDEKRLKNYYSEKDSLTGRIDKKEIKTIIDSIDRMPAEYERLRSRLLLLQLFSYYMDDNDYAEFYEKLKIDVYEYIEKKEHLDITINGMKQAYIGCQYRVNIEDIYAFIMKVIALKSPEYNESVFELMGRINHLSQLQTYQKKGLVDFLVLNVRELPAMSSSLEKALMNIRISFGNQAKVIDGVVKKKDIEFYKGQYSLNVFAHSDKKDWEYIEKLIDKIQTDQRIVRGKEIAFSFTNSYYEIIRQIIIYEKLELSEDGLFKLIQIAFDTLHSSEQLMMDKIEAIMLLQVLYVKQPSHRIVKYINRWKDEVGALIGYEIPFDNTYSSELLYVEWQMLCGLTGMVNEADMANMIVKISDMNVAGQIACLDCIKMIAMIECDTAVKKRYFDMIWIILLMLEKNSRAEVLNLIANIHAYLVVTGSKYMNQSLDRLSIIMDNCGYKTKKDILERIMILRGENATVDAIIQKGRVDNHYVIRKLANGEKIK